MVILLQNPELCLGSTWLVVSTILKNISQWEGLSHILWKIKHVSNHQPEHIPAWFSMFVGLKNRRKQVAEPTSSTTYG